MSTRRPPLASVPNATNSPHRGSNTTSKRPRTGSQLDLAYGQPPPKKQLVDRDDAVTRSPTKSRTTIPYQTAEAKVFSRRTNSSQPTAFEKKLVAARDKERQTQSKASRYEKASAETLDTIRQWQKHYRKAFPGFVFYFDNIPADVRSRCVREVLALGAREERFFSRLVTHVVTSRPIPELDTPSPTETTPSAVEQPSIDGPVQTVNPSLLEKTTDANSHLLRSRNPYDRQLDIDARRDQVANTDVLYRARQMGIKIWAIEKLQRMLAAIHDADTTPLYSAGRVSNAGGVGAKGRGDTELSQVLRNELLHGPSDRDPSMWMKEMVMFKGPFIYVHDMDEKTRPVMVREYPKVARRQDGAWPQFRSAPLGKCPFIEEPPSKKELARMKEKEKEKKAAAEAVVHVQNAMKKPDPPEHTVEINSLQRDNNEGQVQSPKVEETVPAPTTTQVEPQKVFPVRPVSPRKSSESFIAPHLTRTGPFHFGREPAASGVQPSNITSAIRSQMISSTAAAPGAKAGVSKEVHELKRKVLEKSNGTITTSANPSSHRAAEISQPTKPATGVSTRSTKQRPADKLGHIHEEDTTQSEDNGSHKQQAVSRRSASQKKSKEKKRDPKPGYCENCREKFDDFDEHIVTRKHRKFATTMSNWVELDALLQKLRRPLKPEFQNI
ncbi:hypothetical protein VTN77DRAFT_6450 [Rasamsonia byssochlamydoides]|uniref:uncharacterized protein n=1 Tax=Rasamsonia byssochlamydoides TaxID=89139 RepID=UPI003743AF27